MGSPTQLGQNKGRIKKNIRLTAFLEKMHCFTNKNTLAIIFAIGILSLAFIDAKPRVKRNGIQPPCIDFKRVAQHGNYVGNCLSMDSTEMYFCYVRKVANACPPSAGDKAKPSGSFPDLCKAYEPC